MEWGILNWPGSEPVAPQDFDEPPGLVELGDPGVGVPVDDEDVAGRVPGHIGGLVEIVARDTGSRRSAAAAEDAATGAAADFADRLGPAAQGHQDTAGRVELDDHPRGAIHDPEVVLGIDSHALREQERVGSPGGSAADLAQKLSGAIEFEEPRAAVDVGA